MFGLNKRNMRAFLGATDLIRTGDLLITSTLINVEMGRKYAVKVPRYAIREENLLIFKRFLRVDI